MHKALKPNKYNLIPSVIGTLMWYGFIAFSSKYLRELTTCKAFTEPCTELAFKLLPPVCRCYDYSALLNDFLIAIAVPFIAVYFASSIIRVLVKK